jgi:hypothetical protein
MTFGPDGNLYVSNFGFGVPVPGAGEIVHIDLSTAPDTLLHPAGSAASVDPSTVLAIAPNRQDSLAVSAAEPRGRAMEGTVGTDGAVGIAQTPPGLPVAGSQALSFTVVSPSAPSLTSNLPPSARRADRFAAATDQLFASPEPEPSVAVSVEDLDLAGLPGMLMLALPDTLSAPVAVPLRM